MKTEILLHIPHSSYFIPTEYAKLFLLSAKELKQEKILMTDSFTEELFDLPFKKIVFPLSRLVCDVERFRNEKKEEMTKQGMWICYTKTHNLKPLKIVDAIHKQEILDKYYDIHHCKFEKEVENILKANNKCLIIDCHSFPSKQLPYELYKEDSRPDICIGTDNFHTPFLIQEKVANSFKKLGYTVRINEPFKGTIVPLKYYHSKKEVQSIMIEINRSLYMNEKTGVKIISFQTLKQDIGKVLLELL